MSILKRLLLLVMYMCWCLFMSENEHVYISAHSSKGKASDYVQMEF